MKTIEPPGQHSALEFPDAEILAKKNLDCAVERIEEEPSFLPNEKQQSSDLIRRLFERALPEFHKGAKHNPVYHHTQVLDNMVTIALLEKLPYAAFVRSAVLALLHDIGNAVSEREKVKNSQIKKAVKELRAARERQDDIEPLVQQLKELANGAIAFRLEHMDRGPQLISSINETLNCPLPHEDVHYICRAVLIHDYPSIEQTLFELRREGIFTHHRPGQFLLHFDESPVGILLSLLREADRLFMVTRQGVIKDLLDDKNRGDKPITSNEFLQKLADNADRHRDEYELYRDAGSDDWRFRNGTLYRTSSGYYVFDTLSQQEFPQNASKAGS
jgi:hypothetical protein